MSKLPAIIVDIDGTVSYRDPIINRDPFDYSLVKTDLPKTDVIKVVNSLFNNGYMVIFVSARDDSCWFDTHDWLVQHCSPFVGLYMRNTGDFRPDNIVKAEIYRKHIEPKYEVLCVLDDRNKVVDMWREIGLTCLQVAEGDF